MASKWNHKMFFHQFFSLFFFVLFLFFAFRSLCHCAVSVVCFCFTLCFHFLIYLPLLFILFISSRFCTCTISKQNAFGIHSRLVSSSSYLSLRHTHKHTHFGSSCLHFIISIRHFSTCYRCRNNKFRFVCEHLNHVHCVLPRARETFSLSVAHALHTFHSKL